MLKRLGVPIVLAMSMISGAAFAAAPTEEEVLSTWYHLILKLVRHTATYSPPVASRNFAYLGVVSYEAVASGDTARLHSLAGQVHGLSALPSREAGASYDNAAVLNAALAQSMIDFFGNTGPSGQNALRATATRLRRSFEAADSPEILARSEAFGQAISAHIFDWSKTDGGAVITNMGFPLSYTLKPGPEHWVPTNAQGMQQVPLLPDWEKNRPFVMPDSATCDLPPPPAYSEDKASLYYKEAEEVYRTKNTLTDEQRAIARFWSDDPMLSPTPPGHWVSIVLQISEKDHMMAERTSDLLARVGMAVADAFIGCWHTKFEYDTVRPITYIRRVIDPKWETLLITPPFPEYASGHSVQSGAASAVLSAALGKSYAFDDATHVEDGIPMRHFESFEAAAKEAAISRLYGGLHYRAAAERGLDQGRCIGAYAAGLQTLP